MKAGGRGPGANAAREDALGDPGSAGPAGACTGLCGTQQPGTYAEVPGCCFVLLPPARRIALGLVAGQRLNWIRA